MAGTSTKTKLTAVRMPNDLYTQVDQAVVAMGAKNRSDLLLKAVRAYLENLVEV